MEAIKTKNKLLKILTPTKKNQKKNYKQKNKCFK